MRLSKTMQPDKELMSFSSPNSIDRSFEKLRMRTYVKLFKEPNSQGIEGNLVRKEVLLGIVCLIFRLGKELSEGGCLLWGLC